MSAYMIKTIAVYKALTPDLNANAIGGTVNMELREAPSEFHSLPIRLYTKEQPVWKLQGSCVCKQTFL